MPIVNAICSDITARGAPLDLFHAVGKVLHRKRKLDL